MTPHLDAIMESASNALSRMDYLQCEKHCIHALSMARKQANWPYYARILLPLQESRRQRRMIAAESTIRLGTTNLPHAPGQWTNQLAAGCIVITQPHRPTMVRLIAEQMQDRFILALYAENTSDCPRWTLSSSPGSTITITIDAPPRGCIDRWLKPDDRTNFNNKPPDQKATQSLPPVRLVSVASNWFLDACEAMGDAVLAQLAPQDIDVDQIKALESLLLAMPAHELLHQELGRVARRVENH